MNICLLVGVVGSEPRLERIPEHRPLCRFFVKTFTGRYDNGPERSEETHNCLAFGAEAEWTVAHVKCGSTVYLEGKLRHRRSGAEIVCNQIRLLEPPPQKKEDFPITQPRS
jgi:single-stranded DNA-binding protein